MGNDAIKWELALVVVSVVAFAVWQFVTLQRDAEALRRQREAEAEAEAARKRSQAPPDPPPPG